MNMISKIFFATLIISLYAAQPVWAAAPPHPAKKPVEVEIKATLPEQKPGADAKDEAAAFAADAQKEALEETELPAYPDGALKSLGFPKTYVTEESDTLLDIARHFDFGYVEMRAANAAIDPWAPGPETEITLPNFHLLPRVAQKGIVVNLAEMRLYYFYDRSADPLTMPIGIGREGLQTPMGETTVIRKQANPVWFPTERMLEEKPYLPKAVKPGPENPLGNRALYLGWPTVLIHGTNKPWSIGRRVSSGCMRMYPDDIEKLYDRVPVGTKVTVINQPVKIAWLKDGLYLQVHPTKIQSYQLETGDIETQAPLTDKMRALITKEAGAASGAIDWKRVEQAFLKRTGIPVMIVPALEKESGAGSEITPKKESSVIPDDAFSGRI